MKKLKIFVYCIPFFISCNTNKQLVLKKQPNSIKFINYKIKNWQNKDVDKDSIPGISLERAYQELLKNKKGKEVIVAVIDTQLDINHEDLKNNIWINKDEIPNNNIDDDKNGYVDDVNGWNFIANTKEESIFNCNTDYTRFLRNKKQKFDHLTLEDIPLKELPEFIIYKNALKEYNENLSIRKNNLKNFINWEIRYKKTKSVLKKYFPNNVFSLEKLKSIATNDSIEKIALDKLINFHKNGQTDKWLENNLILQKLYLNCFLNFNYKEREIVGGNADNINDKNYGYNNININQDSITYHATYVSGVIAAKRNNNIGVDGISNNIIIMPIVIKPNGAAFDKDIALAIKYAVDNGAKIINMSSSKKYSLHQDWINDALIYATKNDVLFITSSGNNSVNIDKNINYPNNNNGKINNFISVGASTYKDGNLIAYFSNYGKNNVSIFAPGEDILTTKVNNKYKFKDGTSYSSPIVTGVAALILSYYPNLKAHQVKEILLASGVSYDIDVEITDENGKKKLVPFSSLSKSGKIVNAYNALLYAKNYKKWKKGKWSKK